MGSGRRITVGLVGLVLLVVIGWLVKDLTHHSAAGQVGRSASVVTAAVCLDRPSDPWID